MKAKKLVYWTLLIPVVVIIMIVIIVRLDKADNYISRAMASKAMALALTDKDGCLASAKENGSRRPGALKEDWSAKYIDYLLEQGLIEEGTVRDEDYATSPLTYGEAAFAAEQVSPGLSQALNISKKKYDKPMPKEEWWLFYPSFLKAADKEKAVQEVNLLLYGTPDNVKEAAPWTAYTDEGMMGFEGLSMDPYIDHEITVLVRDGEMIHLTSVVSDEVVYRNVWLAAGERDKMNLYIGNIVREFPSAKEVEEAEGGVVADISLSKGKIKKLSLKTDTIEGKVLAVREDSIEIEGYGEIRLDDDFKVYKTYGVVKEQRKKDILVGYNLEKFVVADQKICAALLVKSFSAKNIRVLIMDNGFSSVLHKKITLKADSPMLIEYGDSTQRIEAGDEFTVDMDDERFSKGRIMVEPEDLQKGIRVMTVDRQQGNPEYFGSFEISRESDGLLLVNEVDVEDYLTRVVPSEMPPSYELEALKAQAVCARTYAYRQIQANAYSQYGAHVDDSTNYQVYNNIESNERTDLAIKETDGEMVFYGDAPAETYYFSTSCGYTTDGTIWGADLKDLPYLTGIALTEGKNMEDMTSNDSFVPFIQGQGMKNYDSGYAMYRWSTTITNQKLAEKIDDIGMIQAIFVTERGTGGIAKTVKVVGSEGEKLLKGQTQIRNTLGASDLVYKKNDGKTMTDWSSLPSAFIAVDETARDEEKGIRTFTIWGGGYGHGVGMSQNGAQQMAKEGKTYTEILEFFYRDVKVRELAE